MDQGRMEDFESPLEEILEDLPEEQPPADLKGRCREALDEAENKRSRSRSIAWRKGLRNVVAAAACLVLAVGVTSTLMQRERARTASAMSNVKQIDVAQLMYKEAPASAIPSEYEVAQAPSERVVAEEAAVPEAAPDHETAGAPETRSVVVLGGGPEAPAAEEEPAAAGRPAGGPAGGWVMSASERRAPEPAMAEEAEAVDAAITYRSADLGPGDEVIVSRVTGDTAGDSRQEIDTAIEGRGKAEMAAPSPPVADSWRPQTYAPDKPWRDTSAERQKVTHKQLDLEVQDVEEAYGRSVAIIEKADGYVDTDEITVEHSGVKRARISARIPVKNLEGTLAQLRDLGEVVSLVGQSEDRTKEYQGRGADIRDLGARECELVDQYLKERDRHRKRALYQQIMAIREQNKQRKQALTELSDQTHYAFLDLTLLEKGGPGPFLARMLENTGTVAGWLGATAIFWVPVLVLVALFWRRRKPEEE